MSQEDGLSNGEFEISVAAAAFAIVSLEERDGAKAKGEKEEKRIRTTNLGTNSGSFFWWFSKDEAKDADKSAGKCLIFSDNYIAYILQRLSICTYAVTMFGRAYIEKIGSYSLRKFEVSLLFFVFVKNVYLNLELNEFRSKDIHLSAYH